MLCWVWKSLATNNSFNIKNHQEAFFIYTDREWAPKWTVRYKKQGSEWCVWCATI